MLKSDRYNETIHARRLVLLKHTIKGTVAMEMRVQLNVSVEET